MAYDLSGALLEVCTCNILCPCWVGEDPDNGDCQSIMAWHFDSGAIDGVDVAGLTFAGVMDIPGNVLAGNWRAMVYVDDKNTPQQEEALLNLFTGKLGGPVADLVKLIASLVEFDPVPARTGTLPAALWITDSITSSCSRCERVADSPVVPQGTRPSVPASTW